MLLLAYIAAAGGFPKISAIPAAENAGLIHNCAASACPLRGAAIALRFGNRCASTPEVWGWSLRRGAVGSHCATTSEHIGPCEPLPFVPDVCSFLSAVAC